MSASVCCGATLQCCFGLAPSTLVVPPFIPLIEGFKGQANITDRQPFFNILPFGACISPGNPTVEATGLPTACTPMTVGPWLKGNLGVIVRFMPALAQGSITLCAYGGVIRVINPGQTVSLFP